MNNNSKQEKINNKQTPDSKDVEKQDSKTSTIDDVYKKDDEELKKIRKIEKKDENSENDFWQNKFNSEFFQKINDLLNI